MFSSSKVLRSRSFAWFQGLMVTALAAMMMSAAPAGEKKPAPSAPAKAAPKASAWTGDPYPLDTCVVDEATIGSRGEPAVVVHEGREMKFCCKDCATKFNDAPEKYLQLADERIIKQQLAEYPLDVCPVSGEKLADGTPVDVVYKNRLVRFCCNNCVKAIKKSPEATSAAIAKLDQATIEKQKGDYKLETCPVSGEKLGSMGAPMDVVVGGTLVRLCCGGCVSELRKDPLPALAKVREARRAGGEAPASNQPKE